MEDLSAHLQGLGPGGSAHRHDHEFLNVHVVGGVSAAVENVHHGNGQGLAVDAAQIAVQGHAQSLGSGPGHGHGHRQDGVGAQAGLVGGAVQIDHGLVDLGLVQGVHADDGVSDLGVDVGDRFGHGLAAVGLAAVPQLAGLIDAGGSAGGHDGPAHDAVVQVDLRLHGGVAPGIENLTGMNIQDFKILFHNELPPDSISGK